MNNIVIVRNRIISKLDRTGFDLHSFSLTIIEA